MKKITLYASYMLLLVILSLIITTAYSVFIFTNVVNNDTGITIVVPSWSFNTEEINPGTVITVDEDGNITIDGEEAAAEIDVDGQDTYNNGDVTIKVAADEDGNLVLTEFTTSTTSFWAVLGSDIYLPTAVVIDGVSYPITGISEALDINLTSTWVGTNTIHVPEGYTYICDNAFASITTRATFSLPSTLTSIGSGAFMPGRNVTQTINYAGNAAAWSAIEKSSTYENGRGSLTINYNS